MFLAAIVMLQLLRLRLDDRNHSQVMLTVTRDLIPATSGTRKRAEMRLTIESLTLVELMLRKRRTSIPSKNVVMLRTRRRYDSEMQLFL
jgi:hypothetical protein